MRRYRRPGDEGLDTDAGGGGVQAFEFSVDGITVAFGDGAVYRYDHASAGLANIQQMKQLALNGEGLDRYIRLYARDAHAARLQ